MDIKPLRFGLIWLTLITIVGCGGGSSGSSSSSSSSSLPSKFTIGGMVSGLLPGSSVILKNNGGNPLSVTMNSAFAFDVAQTVGSSYNVTVDTQPISQACFVTKGQGIVNTANIIDVTVQCPSEKALISFVNSSQDLGSLPAGSLLLGSDGNFYGTTVGGGAIGTGTVFKLTPSGVKTILWSFGGVGDGSDPEQSGLIEGLDGNFYGTTFFGGANSGGTVFKVTPTGTESVLWSFGSGADGRNPQQGVIQGNDGNFYGTTYNGGTNNGGTVFKITPSGVETVLWSFDYSNGYSGPIAGVIQARDGNLYGTTYGGGTNNFGTVFKIAPGGVYSVLWNFGVANDGRSPSARLLEDIDGSLYGTTVYGGTHGSGTVFKITSSGVESILWNFGLGNDGARPESGLVRASDGYLYGTTAGGGPIGAGTIFRIDAKGQETLLWGFGSYGSLGSGGTDPTGGVIQGSDGYFYGNAYGGGSALLGTVFRLTL